MRLIIYFTFSDHPPPLEMSRLCFGSQMTAEIGTHVTLRHANGILGNVGFYVLAVILSDLT